VDGHNLEAGVGAEGEQRFVAGDEGIGLRGDGGGEDDVVVGVRGGAGMGWGSTRMAKRL
jgi:hypothetical protein